MFKRVNFIKNVDDKNNIIVKYNNNDYYIKAGSNDEIKVYKNEKYLYIYTYKYNLYYMALTVYYIPDLYLIKEIFFSEQCLLEIEGIKKLRKSIFNKPDIYCIKVLDEYTN